MDQYSTLDHYFKIIIKLQVKPALRSPITVTKIKHRLCARIYIEIDKWNKHVSEHINEVMNGRQ